MRSGLGCGTGGAPDPALSSAGVPNPATVAGTYEANTAGLGGRSIQLGPSATFTLPAQTMSGFRVWWVQDSSFAGPADVKVDGSTVATLSGSAGSLTVTSQAFTTTTASHTVQIAMTGTGAQRFRVNAIEVYNGDATTRVHVAVGSTQGRHLFDMPDNTGSWASHWSQIGQLAPSLVVVSAGDADWLDGSIPFIEAQIDDLVTRIDAAVTGSHSILFVLPPRPVPSSGSPDPSLYAYLAEVLAAKAQSMPDHVAFLDAGALWPFLQAGGATSLGLMAESDYPRTFSNVGHRFYAEILGGVLS